MPAAKVRSARVAVTRVDPEVWVSPDPGEIVRARRPATSARRRSTSTRWAGRCPSGSAATASPSPSTSTSSTDARAATCRSAASAASPPRRRSRCSSCACSPAHPGVVGEGASNLRVLVFNVKGEDLLWLDKPNRFFDDEAAAGWAALGVEPGPFPSVRFWAPARRRSGDVVVPDTGGRHEGVDVFSWTPREFVDEDCLQFLFTDANDSKNQIPFVRERVQSQLKRFAVDVVGHAGRGRAARSARRARRELARPAGPGAGRRTDRHRPAHARRRARRVPGARGRLRARLGVERPGDGRHGLRVHAPAARRRRADGTARARPARAAASIVRRRASPSSRSSRCTTRRSGSWSARC